MEALSSKETRACPKVSCMWRNLKRALPKSRVGRHNIEERRVNGHKVSRLCRIWKRELYARAVPTYGSTCLRRYLPTALYTYSRAYLQHCKAHRQLRRYVAQPTRIMHHERTMHHNAGLHRMRHDGPCLSGQMGNTIQAGNPSLNMPPKDRRMLCRSSTMKIMDTH
jgi:hypothetical protein